MLGLGATVRRLLHPLAWPLGIVFLLTTSATILMYLPMRIDHHGWQLAMLSVTVAGLCDPRDARGGALVGIASAVSLAIGLEMLPYAAMAGAIITLRWIWNRDEARRLAVYAVSLGGGSAAGFAGFASNANYAMRCDALTPVYLSVMVAAGALLFALAWFNPAHRGVRLGLRGAGGCDHCRRVRAFLSAMPRPGPNRSRPNYSVTGWTTSARRSPIYKHPFRMGFPLAALPIVGVVGVAIGTWRARNTPALLGWTCVALFVTFASLMLLWQVRVAPAAQLLAVPGATALVWIGLPFALNQRSAAVRMGLAMSGSGRNPWFDRRADQQDRRGGRPADRLCAPRQSRHQQLYPDDRAVSARLLPGADDLHLRRISGPGSSR